MYSWLGRNKRDLVRAAVWRVFVTNLCNMQVYEYAVNTVLLSFCEDCEEHDGHAQFAPPLLLHALGQAQEHHDRAVAKANDGSVPLDSPTVRTQFISR